METAKRITVKWNGISVTTNFTSDVTAVCTDAAIPKTDAASVLMPLLVIVEVVMMEERY